jgi:hypothetical protein
MNFNVIQKYIDPVIIFFNSFMSGENKDKTSQQEVNNLGLKTIHRPLA